MIPAIQELEDFITSKSTLERCATRRHHHVELQFELLHSDPPPASQKFSFGNNHYGSQSSICAMLGESRELSNVP